MGSYRADRRLLDNIEPTRPVVVTAEQARQLSAALSRPVRVEGDALYVGADPLHPAIGDMRIRYTVAPTGPVSVVAAQRGDGLAVFTTRNGSEIYLAAQGTVPAQDMFRQARDGNQALSWILRVGGVVGLIIGLGLILAPISTLVDVLPPLGAVARFGTGLLAGVGGLAIGMVVIAVSWFVVRPVFAGLSLALVAAIVAGVIWLRRRKPNALNLTPPTP